MNVAVYDPQPPGSTSGPIRWVSSTNEVGLATLTARGFPYAVIDGSSFGIGATTHHVVDGSVLPLGGATPATPSVIAPPAG